MHCYNVLNSNLLSSPFQTAANVVKEQAEADDDTTMQQRLLMGAGTTLEGASELTDNEIASGQYAQHCTPQSLSNLGLPWVGKNVCFSEVS